MYFWVTDSQIVYQDTAVSTAIERNTSETARDSAPLADTVLWKMNNSY